MKNLYLVFILFFSAVYLSAEPLPLEFTDGKVVFKYEDNSADKIEIGASFNGWNPSANPMQKNPDGIWESSISLLPGKYEYKFVINGNWMEGDNLKFFIRKTKEGGLKLTFPGQNKVKEFIKGVHISGEYFTNVIWRKKNYWLEDNPPHLIDLKFAFKSKNIRGSFNVNFGVYKSNLDECDFAIDFNKTILNLTSYKRVLDLKEPYGILTEFQQYFNDDVFFYNDDKVKYRKTGRDSLILIMSRDTGKIPFTFFAGNRYNKNGEEFAGFRTEFKFIESFKLGLAGSYIKNNMPTWGNTNSGEDGTITEDMSNKWMKYFKWYWTHYDQLRILGNLFETRDHKNNFETDIEFNVSRFKFYSAYIIENLESPFAVYIDGVSDTINDATYYNVFSSYRRLGGNYQSDITMGGLIYQSDNFKTGFEIRTIDQTSTEIGTNPGLDLGTYSKKWLNWNYKLVYNHRKNLKFSLKLENLNPEENNEVNYYYLLDDYEFYHIEIAGIKSVNKIYFSIESSFKSHFNFKVKSHINTYDIDRTPVSEDINTNEYKSELTYKITKKLTCFGDIRLKNYKINKFLTDFGHLTPDISNNYLNYSLGLKYELSQTAYFLISYGLKIFTEDEDNETRFNQELQKQFIHQGSLGDYTFLEDVIRAEDYMKNTGFISIEGKLTF